MVGYIYKTTNKKTGKIYIGKRRSRKFDKTYYGSGVELQKDIEKYGYKRFKTKIIKRCYSLKQLNREEVRLIAYWRNKVGKENCYNIAAGGQGGGYNVSKIQRKRRRQLFLGLSLIAVIIVAAVLLIYLL